MNNLKYDDGRIEIMINDDPSRVISFAPDDIGFVNRYYELVDFIDQKQGEYIQRASEIQQGSTDKEKDGALLYKIICEDIKGQIDYVFGVGTSETVFGGSIRLDMFEQFLHGIVPFVKEVRTAKVGKYLQKNGGAL